MGHTVMSQRMVVDIIMAELLAYGKAIRDADRPLYEKLIKLGLKRVGAISYTSSYHTWAFLLLSILLEQEKKILKLNESLVDGRIQEREQNSTMDQDA